MIPECDTETGPYSEVQSESHSGLHVLGEVRPQPPAIFNHPSPPLEMPPSAEVNDRDIHFMRQVSPWAPQEASGVPPGSPRTSHDSDERPSSTLKLLRSTQLELDEASCLRIKPVWKEVATMSKRFHVSNQHSLNSQPSRSLTRSLTQSLNSPNLLIRSRTALFQKTRKGSSLEGVTRTKPSRSCPTCTDHKSFIASPLSKKRLCWDFAGLALLAYDLICVPLQAFELPEIRWMSVLNILICCFWTGDIAASFLVGYYSDGHVEMRPRKIAIHYLRSWFVLDISLVATDWTFLLAGLNTKARFMRLGKVATCMRVLRLARLMKFHIVVSDITEHIHSEHNRTLMHIAKLLALIVAINHFIACGWYGMHHLREDQSWVDVNFVKGDGLGYRYWTSMHWSMTQFTPASMEVVPKNSLERFYTVCVLTFALVTFSSFVSSITQSMTHLRTINARELHQHSTLHRYLSTNTISPMLVNRILHFIRDRNLKKNREVRLKQSDVELFTLLPESVKMDLRSEIFMPIICVHPLFHNYQDLEPAAMRLICKNDIREKTLYLREELFSDHAPLTDAVFLNDGMLAYTYPWQDRECTEIVNKGQWVCEVALWANSAEMFGPLVAEASCQLALLSANGFVSIVRRYEGSAKHVAKYAELFVTHINHLRVSRWARILCNDFDPIRDMAQLAFEDDSANHADDDLVEGGNNHNNHHRSSTKDSRDSSMHTVSDALNIMAGIFSRLPGLPEKTQTAPAPSEIGERHDAPSRQRRGSKGSVRSNDSRGSWVR